MGAPAKLEPLVARLHREMKAFLLVRDIGPEDINNAPELSHWSCIYYSSTHIEICGVIGSGSHIGAKVIMTGRVVQVNPDAHVVVTTSGLYKLGVRQISDKQRITGRATSQLAELKALKAKLEDYHQDLRVASRYMAELTDKRPPL